MKKLAVLITGMAILFAADAFSATITDVMPVLRKAKQNITNTLREIDIDLGTAANRLSNVDLKGDDARKILQDLCKYRPYVIDCSVIDTNGKLITVEPAEYKKYEGSDVSGQQHVILMKRTKKPVLSSTFRSVEGVNAVNAEYPIFSGKGEFLGAVSMLIKADDLLRPIVQDKPCKVWIMQPDGLLVYDADPDQIGRNIFTDEMFKSFDDLISFSKTVAVSKNGAGSYDFYTDGLVNKTLVQKVAVWDTVGLYGTEWRVVVMEIEKTLDKPAVPAAAAATK